MNYGQEYYEKYGSKLYDVNRPLRKSFRKFVYILPRSSTLISFGFGNYYLLNKFAKLHENVYGYDVNQSSVDDAIEHGYEDRVWVQDCTQIFTPKVTGLIAVCYYVFEHIDDKQIERIIINMQLHAPINMIVLTNSEDKQYVVDPTHINPKTNKEWAKMIGSIYTQSNWKKYFSAPFGKFCFVSPKYFEKLKAIERSIADLVLSSYEPNRSGIK
jgi:hypothetical protein